MKSINLLPNGELTHNFHVESNNTLPNRRSNRTVYFTFPWVEDRLTITIPQVLLKSTTQIISVEPQTGEFSQRGDGEYRITPNATPEALLVALQECQTLGRSTLDIVFEYRTFDWNETYSTVEEAKNATATLVHGHGYFNNFNFVVNYLDYEYTIDGVGQLNVTPSNNKVLGGVSSLGATIRVAPSVDIAAGALDCYIYPEGKHDKGIHFYNAEALANGVEAEYTIDPAAVFNIVDANNLDTIYNGYLEVNFNGTSVFTTSLADELSIKSGYEGITITALSGEIHTFSDQKGYYELYSGYVNNLSTPNVFIDSEKYTVDNFLGDNNVTINMTVSYDSTSQSYALSNGVNGFNCPPYVSSVSSPTSTLYSAIFTLTDAYNISSESYTDELLVYRYNVPSANGFNVHRYQENSMTHLEELSDEGEYGKMLGKITITKLPSVSNSATITVVLTNTDDENFPESLPYTCYSANFNDLDNILESDTYWTYNFNDIHINPQTGSPFQSTQTYDFEITVNDGINTWQMYSQFSSATSYFSVEKHGVSIGGLVTGTIENPTFDVHYPAKFDHIESIDQFYGRPYDTGWVDISSYIVQNNFKVYDNSTNSLPCARRIGHVVYLRGAIQPKVATGVARANGLFTGLPEIFWPDYVYNVMLGTAPAGVLLVIGQNVANGTTYTDEPGAMCIRNQTTAAFTANSGYFNLCCNYVAQI